jgi:alpha-glucoside transport system substrate-binding protein
MSTRSRTVLGLAAALLVLLLAVACGGGGSDTGASDTGAGATGGGEQVSGSVSVMGIWTGEEQKKFQAVIDAFNEQQPDVKVTYNPVGDNLPTVLSTAVEGGNPPDIADIAQPGLIQGFVDKGAAKPLDFMESDVQENFGDSIVQVGTFNDQFYGLMFKAFSDAGVEATDDWDTFLQNAETLKASGIPAYSIAGANGWTLTDLFENIYIRTAGADKYDQLSKHEIPWTDQSVKDALTEMAKVVGDGANIAGGTNGALQDDFPTSVGNVLSDNPKAAIVIEGDFVPGAVETTLKPVEGYDVSPFPNINDSPLSVVGGGDIMTMFNDTPASRAFMQFLATPEAAQAWAELGGFSSANKKLDTSVYPDEILRKTASAIGEAEVFRFDLSDLQPAAFGATEGQGLWKLFQDFLKNPNDVDGIAQQMEAAAKKAYG